MTFSSYRITVPGKLLIAGDYAVLEPNQKAVVVAIDRYITANIEVSENNLIMLPQLGLNHVTWEVNESHVQFSLSDSRLHFIQNAMEIANRFLQENKLSLKPFHLTITSNLDDAQTGQKYGLGSSAAVVVAVISAILTVNGGEVLQPSLEQIFKLSAIAHLLTQKNGSGVDIAASTYGGWLAYSSYQPEWVLKNLKQIEKISEFIDQPWPNLSIETLTPPDSLYLSVGWTGNPAKTGPMIKNVEKVKSQPGYMEFLNKSGQAVDQLINAFKNNDCKSAIGSLTKNREALRLLMKEANLSIETTTLKELAEIAERYGSGKSSGAGGGDCGIAFIDKEEKKKELILAWEKTGIVPLKLSVSKKGVSFTEYNVETSLNEYYGF